MAPTRAGNSTPLRIGVVGTGRWGSVLLREANRVADLEVVAAVSPSAPIKSLPVAGVDGFAELSQAVAQTALTAVVVAVPRGESARTVASALDLGLHVLAEKPLCMRADECDSLYDRARAAGRVLRVDYTYLFHEEIQSLLKATGTQPPSDLELRVNDPDRRATRQDVVWDWGPHLMSLAEAFGLTQPPISTPAVAVPETTLTRDSDGWTLTVQTASGRMGRLILRHGGSKARTLRMATSDSIRTVDLLRHTGTSPVRASLQAFADEVRRASHGRGATSDQSLTRAVTVGLRAADLTKRLNSS